MPHELLHRALHAKTLHTAALRTVSVHFAQQKHLRSHSSNITTLMAMVDTRALQALLGQLVDEGQKIQATLDAAQAAVKEAKDDTADTQSKNAALKKALQTSKDEITQLKADKDELSAKLEGYDKVNQGLVDQFKRDNEAFEAEEKPSTLFSAASGANLAAPSAIQAPGTSAEFTEASQSALEQPVLAETDKRQAPELTQQPSNLFHRTSEQPAAEKIIARDTEAEDPETMPVAPDIHQAPPSAALGNAQALQNSPQPGVSFALNVNEQPFPGGASVAAKRKRSGKQNTGETLSSSAKRPRSRRTGAVPADAGSESIESGPLSSVGPPKTLDAGDTPVLEDAIEMAEAQYPVLFRAKDTKRGTPPIQVNIHVKRWRMLKNKLQYKLAVITKSCAFIDFRRTEQSTKYGEWKITVKAPSKKLNVASVEEMQGKDPFKLFTGDCDEDDVLHSLVFMTGEPVSLKKRVIEPLLAFEKFEWLKTKQPLDRGSHD
ncbi:hypothetical protein LTS18_003091 [Coniosporium uncinatum]|uniref:Uncharacterized protein n=1 Tax=Coniosporium uncinatum TaxID=93489 RepID=A0ACC3DBY0_9PEZI|nr:hypothetical protein LTS18_003091 [Coniosporium uncinatum]